MNALMGPIIVSTRVTIPSVDSHVPVTKDICYTMTVQLAMVRNVKNHTSPKESIQLNIILCFGRYNLYFVAYCNSNWQQYVPLIAQIMMNALMGPMIVSRHVTIPSVDTHAHVVKDICYTMTVQLAMVRSVACIISHHSNRCLYLQI